MKKTKNYEKVFKNIEKVRSRNNKNWIDVLRLAFKHAPDEARIIFREIVKKDKELIKLAKELHKK